MGSKREDELRKGKGEAAVMGQCVEREKGKTSLE